MKKSTYKAIDAMNKLLAAGTIPPTEAVESLGEAVGDDRATWDDRTEKWQESEAGAEEAERLEKAEAIVEAVTSLREQLDAATEAMNELFEIAPEGAFDGK